MMKTYVCMLLMMRRRQCAVDDEETAMYEGVQECKMASRCSAMAGSAAEDDDEDVGDDED